MKIRKLAYVAFTIFILIGCKKDEIKIQPLATISVLNAVLDGKVAKLNTNLRDSCLAMNFKHFTIFAGEASVIKVYPTGSPTTTYFNQSPNTKSGEIYSLFLAGTHTVPESVLIKDNIPPYPDDDVINIRLINLVAGSVPISLTMGNEPNVKIFSDITYKQVSEFKTLSFPMSLPANRNLFQIRDNAGNLLFAYNMPATGTVSQASSRKRNITLAYKGVAGGTGNNSLGIIVLPHY